MERLISICDNSLRKKIRHTTPWSINTIWIIIVHMHYLPMATKEKNWLDQFSSKVLKGMFIGNVLKEESGWTGDLPVADAEEVKDINRRRCEPSDLQLESSLCISRYILGEEDDGSDLAKRRASFNSVQEGFLIFSKRAGLCERRVRTHMSNEQGETVRVYP